MTKKKIIIISSIVVTVLLIVFIVLFAVVLPNRKKTKTIGVEMLPTKLTYFVSEKEDFSGLKIRVTRRNNKSYIVDGSECQISGFNSDTPVDEQFITIIYDGFTTGFYIKISPLPTLNPTLTGIKLSKLPKTEYKVGETLDTTGGVITLTFSDNSELRVDLLNKYVSGFSTDRVGEKVLTVKYIKDGVTCSTTYTIRVEK